MSFPHGRQGPRVGPSSTAFSEASAGRQVGSGAAAGEVLWGAGVADDRPCRLVSVPDSGVTLQEVSNER